jgi:radical SAM protein with 4Fe4S-binding SPASM domain
MEEQSQKDCIGTESDDLARYLAKAARTRTPLAVSFELTHRCNFRCVHCYLGDQEAIHKHRHRELDTDTVIRLLDEMVEAGTLFLNLTGGDPMLRPDFAEIYQYAVQAGLLVTVFCNGSLLTDEIVSIFVKYPPRVVEVTVYGATPVTFEAVTQKSGSFAACMEGIERLREAKVRLRLKTIVLTLNVHEFQGIRRLVEDMGLQFRHGCSVIPALPNEDNDGGTNVVGFKNTLQDTLQFRLASERAAAVDLSVRKLRQKLREFALDIGGEQLSNKLYHCGAGRASCHLTPYGKMQPCIQTSQPSGDITGREGFQLGWERIGRQFTAQEAHAGYPCNSCPDKRICSGCPSSFVLETGFQEQVASFYCRYAACRRQEN